MRSVEATASVRPSAGYLFTLGIGCIGLTFMSWGLGGALIGRAGGDPMDVLNVDGVIMFLYSFAIVFAMRLLFWPPVPASVRRVVRLLISGSMVLGVPLAVLGVVLAARLPAHLGDAEFALWFSILACLCQPLAILWLTRYRREGLK